MTNSDLDKLSKRFAISDDVRRLSLDNPSPVPVTKPTLARNLDNSPAEATTTAEVRHKSSPRKKCSELERKFSVLWDRIGGPALYQEYRFHPSRKWRFDFTHFPSKVAVEIEGGIWSGGRHTRGYGFENDAEKYLSATLLGWVVFRLTSNLITTNNCQDIISFIDNRLKSI